MSIKKDIYLALCEQLNTKLNGLNGVPKLQWIDKDMGQLNWLDEYHPIPKPAVLIKFGRTQWETTTGGLQQGDSIIEVSVLFDNMADSFDGSTNQDLALEFFDFNEEVFEALQGFCGENFSALVRIEDDEDTDHKNFIVTPMRFATVITQEDPSYKSQKSVEADVTVLHKKALSDAPSKKATSSFIGQV